MSVSSKSDPSHNDTVEWGGVTIAYSWCHSRRRTMAITIRPDRTVSVRVPLRTSVKEVRSFVTHRAEWVLKVLKKLNARSVQGRQTYSRGSDFMYRGEIFKLELTKGLSRSIQLHDGLLMLTTPEILPEDTVRKMINTWYRKQALIIFKERCTVCHQMMLAECLPLPPITVRTMKTRWGSYSYHTQRISLNQKLINAPPECLDYVIIHELCHIKVRHHGADFWRMVSRYVPDYLKIRRQLNQYI